MGYHPGAEDDAVYLSAIKADLNPALYPHDASFFQLQMRTSVFDNWMAHFVHATGVSVATAEFALQFLSVFFMVWACWIIVSQLFPERSARWGGVAFFASMLTLPVSGTALYIADQYLHPRNPATALILFAVARIQAGRRWQAIPLLLFAFLLHPLMAALGASFCFVLALTLSEAVRTQLQSLRARLTSQAEEVATPVAAFFPFAWLFKKPMPFYMDALRTSHSYFLFEWTWYEWLGVLGPLAILWLVIRIARKQGNQSLALFTTAVLIYGIAHQLISTIILGPKQLIAFSTLEPMRYLQLVYVFLVLIFGAYIGKYLLNTTLWRWTAFLLLTNGGMAYAQREIFPATEHIELPSVPSDNPWVQAFEWISQNTPQNAYFAIDPDYMHAPGNDNHSFRALAERSVLADNIKDTAIVTKSPELGPAWARQVSATLDWQNFKLADFERLKVEFGVNWILVQNKQATGLSCKWHNNMLSVCQIP